MDDQAACLILTVEELEHLTMSNVYRGVCKLCGEVEVTAEYWGESAFSGFSGCGGEERVQCLQQTLGNFPTREPGRLSNFDIQVQSIHKKSLTRQKTEAVKIQTSTATNLLNSKAEHRQPALLKVRMVRENDDNIQRTGQGRGGVKRRRDV